MGGGEGRGGERRRRGRIEGQCGEGLGLDSEGGKVELTERKGRPVSDFLGKCERWKRLGVKASTSKQVTFCKWG